MFEFLTANPTFALLKNDHETVKDLFDKFKDTEGRSAKKKIVDQAIIELQVHATIEEELFYPAVRKFWPGLPDGALAPDYAGIRPKIHGPGEPQPDFQVDGADVHGLASLVALFGIESPGLTSSLAIGEEAARRLSGS